ncbi:MAG: Ig-like domain-containing protein, partial [Planctomycetota bacterium]|nr:Ig-like domain-containing protein [Planctomycetota bacterium]
MTRTSTNIFRGRSLLTLALIAAVTAFMAGCGGGGAGGSEGAGRGLVLLTFSDAGVDNVVLNKRLEFKFSEGLDPSTINNASIQIREGNAFGLTVAGTFQTIGSTVVFEPRLASLCDQSDSGFKPSTRYRVQLMGFPEEFAIRNQAGQALSSTQTYEFFTRADTDPDKYADQIPGVGPAVDFSSPANGDQAVPVVAGNRIEIVMTENLDPCSVNDQTVLVDMYEQGNPAVNAVAPNGKTSGFSSDGTNGGLTSDQVPNDFTTWGSVGTTSFAGAPRRILCDIQVVQDFGGTRIVATPLFGFANGAPQFPENALIVVQLTFGITDFGNLPMQPQAISFTTENLAASSSTYTIENKGETAYIDASTTAAIHPDPRAPERVQAYMLFAGDGDNGADQTLPSLPETPASTCLLDRQPNDGTADDFVPVTDTTLDTGASFNTCNNGTDGSEAVIWEFNSMSIGSGVTVRIVGVNPAIILVQGDVTIESGGRLLVRGDNQGGSPRGDGAAGTSYNGAKASAGGTGVAGGGNGGTALTPNQNAAYGDDGWSGLGSDDYDWSMAQNGVGEDGIGSGRAGQPAGATTSSPWDGSSAAGGGAGHAEPGIDGERNSGTTWPLRLTPRGQGGDAYERTGNSGDKLQKPEAGSGGGSAGFINGRTFTNSTSYVASGGGGGAGGGFLDITSSGDINILGELNAAGGRGGDGANWQTYYASGGGGGGSGGGLRLLTPNKILLAPTSVVTAAGGIGGTGAVPG